MIPIEEIKKYTPIVIINEQNKLEKVDSVALVKNGKIFVSHNNRNFEIPQKKIKNYENNNLLLDFKNKNQYNAFWEIENVKIKGKKAIPVFEQYFPEGENYEVFDVSNWQKLSRCKVPHEGINYITQYYYKPTYAIFAEINVKIDPNFCLIYSLNKDYFFFAPMTQTQKDSLFELNSDFYKAWLCKKDLGFNPKKSLFNPLNFISGKKFQNGVKICRKLCEKLFKILRKKPENFLEVFPPLLEKTNKELQKHYDSIQLSENFKKCFNRIFSLKRSLERYSLSDFKVFDKIDKKKEANALFVFPNGERSLVIIFTFPSGSFRFVEFEHYKSVYSCFKTLYHYLLEERKDEFYPIK